MEKPRVWWTCENRLQDSALIDDQEKPPFGEAFGPFKVVEHAAYEKAVALLNDIEAGKYKYYEGTWGDQIRPDYFTVIRETLRELGELD